MNTKTTKIEEVKTQEGKVGTMLHDVRIKKKLTIEDIAQELRIKTAYLIAIEESDYNNSCYFGKNLCILHIDFLLKKPYHIDSCEQYAIDYKGRKICRRR